MAYSTSASLNVTIANAIAYLTRPLIRSHSATTIVKLQLILEANLTAFYAPTWVIKEPLRGSGRRCLTLSPTCLPPRPIYAACLAASVNWFDWIAVLGSREFDFFVDPGCISVRYAHAVDAARLDAQLKAQADVRPKKTFAQQILEEDAKEDDELFAMLAEEISVSTWNSPLHNQSRSASPLSDISSASSCGSFSSAESYASVTRMPTRPSPTTTTTRAPAIVQSAPYKMSRRERARQARVFIDASKIDVTPYDGGKTTVLTGGVMLGGAPKARVVPARKPQAQVLVNWRSVRA
jgi:hypothetical protein